jgi:hypothetical protein
MNAIDPRFPLGISAESGCQTALATYPRPPQLVCRLARRRALCRANEGDAHSRTRFAPGIMTRIATTFSVGRGIGDCNKDGVGFALHRRPSLAAARAANYRPRVWTSLDVRPDRRPASRPSDLRRQWLHSGSQFFGMNFCCGWRIQPVDATH